MRVYHRVLTLALLALAAGLARADGVLIPVPPPHPPRPVQYLSVKNHHVTINVQDQVLQCTIDQVFHNPNPYNIEGEYLFPVPSGATVSRLNMEVDGKPLEGKMLPRDEARSIYENIVRSMRDPALLEYVGRDTFRARIFPIPANGDKQVVIRYEQVVRIDNGIASILYPLNTEKFSSQPLEDVSIAATIESTTPIASVYSPSHKVDVSRVSDRKVIAGWEAKNVRPDTDFMLYYTVSHEQLGVHVLSTKPEGETEGYFLLLAAPAFEDKDARAIPKDVVFVIDTSGSMAADGKISQVKQALEFCLRSLHDDDRVNVVRFATSVDALADTLRPVKEVREKALALAHGLEAAGGTNMEGALRKALDGFPESNRPKVMVLLTDGNPTVGNTNLDSLQTMAKDSNKAGTRLFTFGVGYDVNVHFLDELSDQNGGLSQYVRPGEDLEIPVSSFFAKLSRPALAGIELAFPNMTVTDIYPQKLPDLFHGSELLLAGRYTGGGSATVLVKGTAGDKPYANEFSVHFAEGPDNDYVPRLWAARKIGFLLDQVRLHGRNQEVVDEIVALSLRFGIMTEYTAFLVEEGNRAVPLSTEARTGGPGTPGPTGFAGAGGMGGGFGGRAGGAMDSAAAVKSGSWAVSQQQNAQSLQLSGQVADNRYKDAEGRERQIAGIRYIAGRAFYFRNGRWEDANFREGQALVQVQSLSNAQFALSGAVPVLNQYLSLGEHVVVWANGRAVEFGTDGKTDLTADEVAKLTADLKAPPPQQQSAPPQGGGR